MTKHRKIIKINWPEGLILTPNGLFSTKGEINKESGLPVMPIKPTWTIVEEQEEQQHCPKL